MGPRVIIRPPTPRDAPAFLAAVAASRPLHHPWVTPPDTPATFATYLERMTAPQHAAFLICRRDTDELAGVVNVTQITLGPLCSAYLGYYAFADHAHQGFMSAGLRAVTRHAFGHLGLHRLEANIQPNNAASIALARSCGFVREGYSPRYLKIGGRWRDHERWAIRAS
ncbi:MAG TPA: GNAT family protein [Rhodanobacteraceae bacterium]